MRSIIGISFVLYSGLIISICSAVPIGDDEFRPSQRIFSRPGNVGNPGLVQGGPATDEFTPKTEIHVNPTYTNVEVSEGVATSEAEEHGQPDTPLHLLLQQNLNDFKVNSSIPESESITEESVTEDQSETESSLTATDDELENSDMFSHSAPTRPNSNIFKRNSQSTMNLDNSGTELSFQPTEVQNEDINKGIPSDVKDVENPSIPTEEAQFNPSTQFLPSHNLNKRNAQFTSNQGGANEEENGHDSSVRRFNHFRLRNNNMQDKNSTLTEEEEIESTSPTAVQTEEEESSSDTVGNRFHGSSSISRVPLTDSSAPSETPSTDAAIDEKERKPVQPVRSFGLRDRIKTQKENEPSTLLFEPSTPEESSDNTEESSDNTEESSDNTEESSDNTEESSDVLEEGDFDLTPISGDDPSLDQRTRGQARPFRHNVNKRSSQFDENESDAGKRRQGSLHQFYQKKRQTAEQRGEDALETETTLAPDTEDTEIDATTESDSSESLDSGTQVEGGKDRNQGIFSTLMNLFKRKPSGEDNTTEESASTPRTTTESETTPELPAKQTEEFSSNPSVAAITLPSSVMPLTSS